MSEQQEFERFTAGGYRFDEVTSALQKSIRRGQEVEAVFWAQELESRYYRYLWKRLVIIYHEDIGLADQECGLYLEMCRKQYFDLFEAGTWENLPLINAVVRMARAKKTRVSVALHVMIYESDMQLEVPDEALDMHTEQGRAMGRDLLHFQEEGAMLVNEDLSQDPENLGAILHRGEVGHLRKWAQMRTWSAKSKSKTAKKEEEGDGSEAGGQQQALF